MKKKICCLLTFTGIHIGCYLLLFFLISLCKGNKYTYDLMYYLGDSYVNLLFSIEQFVISIALFCVWALIKPINLFSGSAILLFSIMINIIIWMFFVPQFYPVFFTDYFFTVKGFFTTEMPNMLAFLTANRITSLFGKKGS